MFTDLAAMRASYEVLARDRRRDVPGHDPLVMERFPAAGERRRRACQAGGSSRSVWLSTKIPPSIRIVLPVR